MKNLITWSLLLLLFSCSPQRRLNRLVRKHPELVRVDSVVRIDTIVVQRFDTIVNSEIVYHDSTVVINNDRVKLQYYFDTVENEIWHEVECKEVYVKDTNVVKIERLDATIKSSTNWIYTILCIIAVLLFWQLIFRK